MKYLSPETKWRIKNAEEGTRILLSAPTGSGKTTFVLNELCNTLKLRNGQILLVVNRSVLRCQVILDILKNYGQDLSDFEIELENGLVCLETITIVTYQYLFKRVNNDANISGKIGPCQSSEYDYIIFDECHFFLADAFLTARESWKLFDICRVLNGKRRVYVSATMVPELKRLILDMEGLVDIAGERGYELVKSPCYVNRYHFHHGIPVAKIEVMELTGAEPDYSYFIPRVIPCSRGIDEDIVSLTEAKRLKKALAFVSSKAKGKEIKEKLNHKGIKSVFIFIETKTDKMGKDDLEVLRSIQEAATIPDDIQVVLATKILDNGVSIHDVDLTHLYVEGCDRISAVQEAGRIRVSDGQRVELVIPEIDPGTLSKRAGHLEHRMRLLERYYKLSESSKNRLLLDGEFDDIRELISSEHQSMNPFLEYANSYFQGSYTNRILGAINGNYSDGILKWFGLSLAPENDEVSIEKNGNLQKLIAFMAESQKQEMSKEDLQNWKTEFMKLYCQVFGKPEDYRSDRTPSNEKVKGYLEGMRYSLDQRTDPETRKEKYRIIKTEGNGDC